MSKTKRLGKGLGELLGKEVMEEKNTIYDYFLVVAGAEFSEGFIKKLRKFYESICGNDNLYLHSLMHSHRFH